MVGYFTSNIAEGDDTKVINLSGMNFVTRQDLTSLPLPNASPRGNICLLW